MKVLALCGSLRQQSRSLALLQATGMLTNPSVHFVIHPSLGDLPLFNPDQEHAAPASVQALWQAISWADALIIASPEYAHGVTGTIKNALDWLVAHPHFSGKPVAVFNPSHRAEHAHQSLLEILQTMDARLVADACLSIPATGGDWSASEMARTAPIANLILAAWAALSLAYQTANPECQ